MESLDLTISTEGVNPAPVEFEPVAATLDTPASAAEKAKHVAEDLEAMTVRERLQKIEESGAKEKFSPEEIRALKRDIVVRAGAHSISRRVINYSARARIV